MKKMLNRFEAESEKVFLTPEEKSVMRQNILDYMEANPITGKEPAEEMVAERFFFPEFSFTALIFSAGKTRYALMMIALFLFLGGGISYAAGGALPGDRLYPVKISFNEEIRGMLNLSPEARAKWEANLFERRLEETQVMAADSRLDERSQIALEQRMDVHAGRVRKEVEELKKQNKVSSAVTINLELESSLKAHEEILDRLAMRNEIAGQVASKVRTEILAFNESRADLEHNMVGFGLSLEESYGGVKDRQEYAKLKWQEADKVVKALSGEMSSRAIGEARQRLNRAASMLLEAESEIASGNYSNALLLYNRAVTESQQSKVSLNARRNLQIDLVIGGLVLDLDDESIEFRIVSEEIEEGEETETSIAEGLPPSPDEETRLMEIGL
jgi:hypothetical protein